MTARFLVEAVFHLTSRGVFVAHGQILDGAVRRGQRVRAPDGLDAPVEQIEFVLISASEGRENPALVFRYRDEAELARWQSLALEGQTLVLEDGESGASAV